MIINSTPTHWRAHFDSAAEAAHYLETTPSKWNLLKDHVGRHYADRSWTLGCDFKDVMRLAKDGWEDGTRNLETKLRGIPPRQGSSSSWTYDVAGYVPDVPRYLSGEPANMMRHGHPKGHKPIVSLCVMIWINAGINAAEMVNYGTAMTALIDQIEQAGRRVELWAGVIAPHVGKAGIMSATWTVKSAEDHVDLAAVAFSLAHPGASRKLGWGIWERSDRPADRSFGQGGYTTKLADVLDPPHGMVFLGGVANSYGACSTMDKALPFVAKQINLAAGEQLVEVEN